jgi:hypothetical protein
MVFPQEGEVPAPADTHNQREVSVISYTIALAFLLLSQKIRTHSDYGI